MSPATNRAPAAPPQSIVPCTLAQPTFAEAHRVARGLALGPTGIGWRDMVGEFGLTHHDAATESHHLRLEGGLIPDWFGRPSDIDSLRRELAATGHDGIALELLSIALVLRSDAGHLDITIDELIARIGIDPRSTAERADARLRVWRILTILGAMRVVGARTSVVRDRVSGRTVRVESADPLITVSAWRHAGAQMPLDAGVAPLKVTISASPWLTRLRGNRAALQEFGDLLAISEIPIRRPSGAWARAIGLALHQFWREQATRATYGRAGDSHRLTVRFRDVTRRELLEMFPAHPSVDEVLSSGDPRRAIDYWDAAIAELKARRVIGRYGATRDWLRDRPRKGWANLWLDEPLQVSPPAEAAAALQQIATAANRKNSKLRESIIRRA